MPENNTNSTDTDIDLVAMRMTRKFDIVLTNIFHSLHMYFATAFLTGGY